MKETNTHIYFWGSIYSQWTKSFFIEYNIQFTTAEQYMMYHKALLFDDTDIANQILSTSNAREQKELGRKVKLFDVNVWDQNKLSIITQGNYLKFSQNKKLKDQLLKTGTKILVEGSPYDKIYGVGLKWDNPLILDEKNWKGQNLLGKALMDVRAKLSR